MDNEYVLYCNPSAILKEHPCNSGIYEALKRTEELSRQGVKVRLVNAAQMTEGDRFAVYVRATTPRNEESQSDPAGLRKPKALRFHVWFGGT